MVVYIITEGLNKHGMFSLYWGHLDKNVML